MIELELTPKIKAWLEAEPERRDLGEGAELLLRTTRNRILYANVSRNPGRNAGAIEYHLKKEYQKRLADTTHAEVKAMMGEVGGIARARGLDRDGSATERTAWQKGKRADHDELPEEIQKLYTDNADIMRRMRDAHTKLRLITPETSTCPDNDRYPIAKYLIAQDRLYRDNWNKYDHYIKGTPAAATEPAIDTRTEQRNAEKLCHMLLGQYSKAQSEQTAERIREAYARIGSPSESLRQKMEAAGLKE